MRRVVLTGIGLITPLGIGVEATWGALIDGCSAVGPFRAFDASSLRTRMGAEVSEFNAQDYVANRRSLRTMTRSDQFAVAGAALAVRDAHLELAPQNGERAALFVGGSKELSDPMQMLEPFEAARNPDGSSDMQRFGESALSNSPPLFYVEGLQAASLFYVSVAHGLKGANAYFAGGAESGAVAIGTAYRAIRRGEADVALAGGFDDAVSWWTMSKYDSLGILSTDNDAGSASCRPYDRNRNGTVLGEGAAVFVLEEYEDAHRRGATIYAEITGFGSGLDAYKVITPQPEGRGLRLALQSALREAQTSPDAVGYVAAHGSGTKLGDASEAEALRTVFGSAADRLLASSVKAATGHLIAGAGALNVAVAALVLQRGVVPPTLNLTTPDPACSLDWVAGQARELRTDQTLALARGLEGQNVVLALRAIR